MIQRKHQISLCVFSFAFLLALLLASTCGCLDDSKSQNQDRRPKSDFSLSTLNPGSFEIDHIIDGDTLQIEGIKKSVRLLCVDTEEIFKQDKPVDRKLAYDDWNAYLKIHDKSGEIEKYPTPFGDKARKYAQDFFKDISNVIIELDSLDRLTCFFDRHLGYVLIEKNGQKFNLNVELVRNGFSPYYTKYGYSKRYHQDFIDAEKEARGKKLGVWSDAEKHYTDYPERIELWNTRADQIKQFEELFSNDRNYFLLQNDSEWSRLGKFTGREITIFGTIDDFRKTGPPYRIFLSHKIGRSIVVNTGNKDLFDEVISNYNDEKFIYFTGILEKDKKYYRMEMKSLTQVTRDPPEKKTATAD